MKIFEGYTRPAIAVAFGTSLLYVLAFMILKAYEQNGWLITINVVYALFVLLTVVWDRKDRFKTTQNAKLVTLGTAVAPIAANISDVLFTLVTTYPNEKWPLAVYFGVTAFIFFLFHLLLCFLIPVKNTDSTK